MADVNNAQRGSTDKSVADAAVMDLKPMDQEAGSFDGQDSTHRQKDSLRNRVLRVVWDSLDKSPEERRFVNKADWWIMTYVCLAYFVKYLDQTNVCLRYFHVAIL